MERGWFDENTRIGGRDGALVLTLPSGPLPSGDWVQPLKIINPAKIIPIKKYFRSIFGCLKFMPAVRRNQRFRYPPHFQLGGLGGWSPPSEPLEEPSKVSSRSCALCSED